MTDVFRKEYKPLTDDQKIEIELIKNKADELLHEFNMCTNMQLNPDPRMMALAKTKLEECVMWACKAIT